MNEIIPVSQLKTEILFYKNQTANNILEIGKRLLEVKKQLPHGEFMDWCEKEVDFTHQTANKFMSCYERFGNYATSSNLNSSQMFELLSLPEEKTEEFIQTHDVEDMTVKALREEIKSYKSKAEAYDNDMQTMKERVETEQKEKEGLKQANEKLLKELDNIPKETITKEVIKEVVRVPDDYKELKEKTKEDREVIQEYQARAKKAEDEANSLRHQLKIKNTSHLQNLDLYAVNSIFRDVSMKLDSLLLVKDEFKYLKEDEITQLMKLIKTPLNKLNMINDLIISKGDLVIEGEIINE